MKTYIQRTHGEGMVKIMYLTIIMIILMLFSGCIIKEQTDESIADKGVKETYIVKPTSNYQETKNENDDFPSLSVTGMVTYNDNTMSGEREYSVDVNIYNIGKTPAIFEKIVGFFYDYRYGFETDVMAGGPSTLGQYYGIIKNFESYDVVGWQQDHMVMYVYLAIGDNRTSKTYATSLPPLENLENKYESRGQAVIFSESPLPSNYIRLQLN